jgi:Spy/CpxP family protein refolding chaperone
MSRLTRSKAVLYLTAIFLAGTTAGFVAGHAFARRQMLRPPPTAEMTRHLVARLQEDLKLTPEQLENIRPLVERNSSELDVIHRESWDRVSESFKRLTQQMAGYLTVEQKKQLAAMESVRRRLIRERCGPRDPGGTGPACHARPE